MRLKQSEASVDMTTKLYRLAETKSVDAKARTIRAWASRADVVDRDGELIAAEAWQHPDSTADFERNPVLCAFHKYDLLPLGKILSLEKNKKGLAFEAVFAKTAAAIEAFDFIVEMGGMASFSVAFLPKSSYDMSAKELSAKGVDTANARGDRVRVFDYVQLIEISLAPVPSNPRSTALGLAYLDGKVKTKELRLILEPWAAEIDAAQLGGAIDKAVGAAVSNLDLGSLVQAAVDETKKGALNEQLRKHVRASIMTGIREGMKQEKAAEARRLRERVRGPLDMNDPHAIEEYVSELLQEIDFDKLMREKTELAILKAKGRVR